MTKKKTRRKLPPSRMSLAVVPMDTEFPCPFCHHDKSCDVVIDRTNRIGKVFCRVCKESYQTLTNNLSEAIDVYSEWIDRCEEVND